jgi:hypothetical protein
LNRSKEARHDLARGVFAVIRSSGAPVEAAVLGVSVAIETLVDATYPDLKKTSADFIAEIEDFRARLPDLELSPEITRRLNGCLNTMKAEGTANALRNLLPKLHLEQRLFDSWNTLRNRYAHGGAIPWSRVDEIYDHVRNVVYLAWSIVIESIGYTGPRTNYSLRGQPPVSALGEVIKYPSP